MEKLNVHLKRELPEEVEGYLREHLESGIALSFGDDLPQPADYQVLVSGRPPREFLDAGKDLHTVIIPWAGVSRTTRELLDEYPDIALHNLHHNAAPTAEAALALMFAAAKSVLPLDRALREGDWTPRYEGGHSLLLAGKQALIVGYGEIGRRVGEALLSLGAHVRGIRKHQGREEKGEVAFYPPSRLADLLPTTDLLFLTLPLTPETKGLIGEEELGYLPQDAILVNVSRGPVVDQEALYHALRDGRLFGAGLDVWYNYPREEEERANTPPADFPFHELDNVVMSPHRGGSTLSTERLRMTHLARLLNAIHRGEDVPNRVDLTEGY